MSTAPVAGPASGPEPGAAVDEPTAAVATADPPDDWGATLRGRRAGRAHRSARRRRAGRARRPELGRHRGAAPRRPGRPRRPPAPRGGLCRARGSGSCSGCCGSSTSRCRPGSRSSSSAAPRPTSSSRSTPTCCCRTPRPPAATWGPTCGAPCTCSSTCCRTGACRAGPPTGTPASLPSATTWSPRRWPSSPCTWACPGGSRRWACWPAWWWRCRASWCAACSGCARCWSSPGCSARCSASPCPTTWRSSSSPWRDWCRCRSRRGPSPSWPT